MATAAQPEVVVEWEYQDEHAFLMPYIGPYKQGLPEDFLASLFFRTRDQKLLDLVMPGIEDHSLNGFIKTVYGKPLLVGLTKPDYAVAAYAWIWGVEGQDGARKAHLGFLFFREYWAKPVTRSLARLALRWWFVRDNIDVLYGTTLQANNRAKNYAKRFGFKVLADLPKFFIRQGQAQAATLVVLEKEDFLAREVKRCAG